MSQPLYTALRPKTLEGVVGQRNIVKLIAAFMEQGFLPSMIFYGPPGSGKTTIAKIIAELFDAKLYYFSGVKDSTTDIKKQIYQDRNSILVKKQILFVDEIHRFNKAQQDIFLPMIEEEGVVFIGATTENPSFYVNNALLSRTRSMRFEPISVTDNSVMIRRGVETLGVEMDDEVIAKTARASEGDIRISLSILESAYYLSDRKKITDEDISQVIVNPEKYDKKGDYHYRIISAFIKSLRGSDPDAALYYMVKMLDGGEDPLFILRRMIIFASEDVANADPRGLQIAVAGLDAFRHIGMPEGEIIMSHVVTYLATAPKCNSSYMALKRAKEFYKENPNLVPPQYLINSTSLAPEEEGGDYQYPHDHPGHWVDVKYFPGDLKEDPVFYELSEMGYEAKLREFREKMKTSKKK